MHESFPMPLSRERTDGPRETRDWSDNGKLKCPQQLCYEDLMGLFMPWPARKGMALCCRETTRLETRQKTAPAAFSAAKGNKIYIFCGDFYLAWTLLSHVRAWERKESGSPNVASICSEKGAKDRPSQLTSCHRDMLLRHT